MNDDIVVSPAVVTPWASAEPSWAWRDSVGTDAAGLIGGAGYQTQSAPTKAALYGPIIAGEGEIEGMRGSGISKRFARRRCV